MQLPGILRASPGLNLITRALALPAVVSLRKLSWLYKI
jgi:hypothetical protein